MSSQAMEHVLRELENASDLVIIDTPAALAVSDPLPLMRSVSGVVLVARMNRSSRQTINRLQQIVESAHGKLLGVIATGTSVGPGYGHYYPKYYGENGANGAGGRGLRRRRTATVAAAQNGGEARQAQPDRAQEPLAGELAE
jgi:Mrp family chromosome partitioning ATPase